MIKPWLLERVRSLRPRSPSRVLPLVAIAALLPLTACSDNNQTEPADLEHVLETVHVTSNNTLLKVGETMQLAALGRCSHGDEIDATFAWASSDNTVATVSPTGLVTALTPGPVTLVASASGKAGEITIVVQAAGSMIGAAGGTVISADGVVELEIPAGALDAPTDIVIEKANEGVFTADALFIEGTAYTLKPLARQLLQPARLRIRYNPALVPQGLFNEQLRLKLRDQDQWRETAQNAVQPHVVQAQIQTFGVFGITYEPAVGTMIGVNGGTVQSSDGKLILEIPPFALNAPVDIVITKLGDGAVTGVPLYVRGTVYDLKPIGVHFNLPAQLTIRFEPNDVPATCELDRLRVQMRNEPQNQWVATQMQRLRLDEYKISAEITAFSVFAIVGLPKFESTPARVDINPSTIELEVEDVAQASAAVSDAGGNVLDLPVIWTSTDPSVAVVDANGRVLGVAAGSAALIARSGGVSGDAIVKVSRKTAAKITLTPDPDSVQMGKTIQLTAVARDKGGAVMTVPFQWTSYSASIATVDASGMVTGVGLGSVLIAASYYGTTGYATVTVTPGAVARITIAGPANKRLELGHHRMLKATARDDAGNSVDVPLVWTSSDTTVLTVDSSGRASGVGLGSATVTASYEGVSDSVRVVVYVPIERITIAGSANRRLAVGYELTLEATAYDAAGNAVPVPLEWISSDAAIVSVDSTGRVTGVSIGSATVTASWEGVSASVSIETFTVGGPGGTAYSTFWPAHAGLTGLASPGTMNPGAGPRP